MNAGALRPSCVRSFREDFGGVVEPAPKRAQTRGLNASRPRSVVFRERSMESIDEASKVVTVVRSARHAGFIGVSAYLCKLGTV